MKVQKITLMYGIPSSGKTTEANKMVCPLYDKHTKIIDMDEIGKEFVGEKFYNKLVDKIKYSNYQHLILDGLITTNANADKLFSAIQLFLGDKIKFHIIWWSKDVNACLHNDKNRRDVSSEITIKNIAFEEPSKELLEKFSIKAERRKVVRKPAFQCWLEENKLNEKELKSDTWTTGGTCGSYQGNIDSIDPDPQPTTFVEFDDLLLKICPNISFLQYKKLYNESVTIKQDSYDDYYGGHRSYANFVCNLGKLYEMLNCLELITTDK